MPGYQVIGGRIVKTVPEVLDAYQPTITRISAAQWARTRALVVAAVEGAHYPSIHGAHLALRVVSAFVAWAEDEGVELPSCTEGEPCACGTTVTLGPDDRFGTRQRLFYGTTAWKASYGRRSAVESANANLKVHHAHLRRGSTRVMGTNRTGILLAFIIAAVNVSVLHSRYDYDAAAPTDGTDPITSKPSPRPALHRSRDFQRRPGRRKSPPGRAATRPSAPRRPDTFDPVT